MKHQPYWVTFLTLFGLVLLVTTVKATSPVLRRSSLSVVNNNVGDAFTFQGSLNDKGYPANGIYDFEFRLYDDPAAGNQVGDTLISDDIAVTNGLFTLGLDLGDVFDGTALWLSIGVRNGDSIGNYTLLNPRQAISAVPYALHTKGDPARVPEGAECDAIQRAIDRLPASGGQVVISKGVFTCTTAIVIDRDNVDLRGQGPATVLLLADGANSPVLILGQTVNPPSLTRTNLRVSDLLIDGNRENQTEECWGGVCDTGGLTHIRNNGITLRGVSNVMIERVIVSSARSGGLVSEKVSRKVTVRDFVSFDNHFDGLAAYDTEDSLFSGLSLYDNLAAGLSFDLNFNHNIVGDAVIRDNGSVGIFMVNSHDNQFHDLQILNSREHGIFLAQGTDDTTAATGNTFAGMVISNSGQEADPGTEGFCVDGFIGGAGICLNNPSNVNNLLVGAQFINNLGGCIVEATPGLLQQVGSICR